MNANIQTVLRIYEAFGRGDVPTILEAVHPDVDWEYGQGPSTVPYLQPRRGHAGVVSFFEALGGTLRLERLDVNDVVGDDKVVVALITMRGEVIATGATVSEEDEAHVWRFDDAGRVVRFRHGVDTAQHERAVRG